MSILARALFQAKTASHKTQANPNNSSSSSVDRNIQLLRSFPTTRFVMIEMGSRR